MRQLLLPLVPDSTCTKVRTEFLARYGKSVAIIINDSVGRAWRVGTVGIALGASGLESVLDLRGQEDLYGRPLMVSIVGMGDELAAAASIVGLFYLAMPITIIGSQFYKQYLVHLKQEAIIDKMRSELWGNQAAGEGGAGSAPGDPRQLILFLCFLPGDEDGVGGQAHAGKERRTDERLAHDLEQGHQFDRAETESAVLFGNHHCEEAEFVGLANRFQRE